MPRTLVCTLAERSPAIFRISLRAEAADKALPSTMTSIVASSSSSGTWLSSALGSWIFAPVFSWRALIVEPPLPMMCARVEFGIGTLIEVYFMLASILAQLQ